MKKILHICAIFIFHYKIKSTIKKAKKKPDDSFCQIRIFLYLNRSAHEINDSMKTYSGKGKWNAFLK